MALKDLVEDYTGTVTDTTSLDNLLTQGARMLVDILPLNKAELFTTDINVTVSGADLSAYRFMRAHKSGYGAVRISADNKARAADVNSLYYATNRSPVHYIENGKLYILPGGGTGVGIAYPTVTYNNTSIGSFPSELQHAVILYAAEHVLIQRMNDKVVNLEGINLEDVSVPVAPNAPAISYTNATATGADTVTIASPGTVPSYTKPTVVLTAAPDISDLNVSAISVPTAPGTPVISFSDASLVSVAATTISALQITVPTYTKPTVSLLSVPSMADLTIETDFPAQPSDPSYTTSIGNVPEAPVFTAPTNTIVYTNTDSALTNVDIELAAAHLSKVQTQLQQYAKDLEVALGTFNSNKAKFDADVQKLVQQASISSSESIQKQAQKLEKYAADVNLYSQYVNKEVSQYKLNLDKLIQFWQIGNDNILKQYSLEIQNELNRWQRELRNYEIDANHKIEQAKLTLNEALENAKNANNIALQNEIQTAQTELANYELTVKKHQAMLDSYSKQVESAVVVFKANYDKALQIWQTKRANELQQYSLDIQNELNEFQKELAAYQSDIQIKVEQAKISLETALTDAKTANDIETQNKIQTMQAAIANYQSVLGKYNGEIQSYGVAVNQAVSKYNTAINQKAAAIDSLLKQISAIKAEFRDFLLLHGLINDVPANN
jgi:hypothetical protein